MGIKGFVSVAYRLWAEKPSNDYLLLVVVQFTRLGISGGLQYMPES